MSVIESLIAGLRACRIVDLSRDVGQHAKGPFQTRMEVLEPEPGAQFFVDRVLSQVVPSAAGKVSANDFPDGAFLRHELVTASTHAGSHVDAPGHYGPTKGTHGLHINDAPLASFLAPGVMVDAASLSGDFISLAAFDAIRERDGIDDVKGRVVLVRTGGDKALDVAIVEKLLDQGCQVIGVDSESFDGPVPPMISRFLASRNSGDLWPCHMLGRRRPYYQLERLANLEALPPKDFLVIALPIRINGATAAWTRAIALLPGTH